MIIWNERRRTLIEKACEMNKGSWVTSRELFETLTVKERKFFKSLVQFQKFLLRFKSPMKKINPSGGRLYFMGASA